ncbi:MAG: VOC family protein [Carnobacterium sp.]|uniref:VOC family protein n=1 Tax=Carnobacterium sp. TaxID=48221 RepID=UPI003C77C190
MAIGIYLTFDGNAREVVDFYSDVFNVEKNDIMTYGDRSLNPNIEMVDDDKTLIMNTELDINGTTIMFSDWTPSMTDTPFIIGNNISIVVDDHNKEYIIDLFEKLKEDGKVEMELTSTFWSELFGSVTDKFGITWELNYNNQ